VWRSLPPHVTYEGISSLHAEHGGRGTKFILHDLIKLVGNGQPQGPGRGYFFGTATEVPKNAQNAALLFCPFFDRILGPFFAQVATQEERRTQKTAHDRRPRGGLPWGGDLCVSCAWSIVTNTSLRCAYNSNFRLFSWLF
jgi:hypothetical protein